MMKRRRWMELKVMVMATTTTATYFDTIFITFYKY